MLNDRYFLEIGIYRISREKFSAQYDRDLAKRWKEFEQSCGTSREKASEHTRMMVEQHFWETYGGPWHYNQAIGWIRIFVCGSQIRGDYWRMAGKRYQRKTRNQYQLVGKMFELQCWPEQASEEIATEMDSELTRIANEISKRGWVLDLEGFQTIAPCVDWRRLVQFDNK